MKKRVDIKKFKPISKNFKVKHASYSYDATIGELYIYKIYTLKETDKDEKHPS